jgi:hypothetical protein
MPASSGADGPLYALHDSVVVCSYAKELRIFRLDGERPFDKETI